MMNSLHASPFVELSGNLRNLNVKTSLAHRHPDPVSQSDLDNVLLTYYAIQGIPERDPGSCREAQSADRFVESASLPPIDTHELRTGHGTRLDGRRTEALIR
jgi:hypothetical protein